ncbi:MAG TPA: hypothetical protein PKD00_00395 [Burkholderiales bacterium]|nr:hypothetical protein [Burkholderiales bacterium]
MACNCVKDFGYIITADTCKRLLYQDVSVWMEMPEEYTITITTPTNIEATITVASTGVTIINSILLGISTEEVNLPPGVYCIRYTKCNGDVVYKDYLNLCVYECELANLLANVDMTKCNSDLLEELENYRLLKYLLEGAKAKFECDWCSVQELKTLLLTIKEKLKGLNCNCK